MSIAQKIKTINNQNQNGNTSRGGSGYDSTDEKIQGSNKKPTVTQSV